MNKTFREVLLYTLIPLFILLMACMTGDEGILAAGMLALFIVGIYFLVGIILLLTARFHTGKVLLLSAGIILLVGLSTCGLIMSGLRINH